MFDSFLLNSHSEVSLEAVLAESVSTSWHCYHLQVIEVHGIEEEEEEEEEFTYKFSTMHTTAQ